MNETNTEKKSKRKVVAVVLCLALAVACVAGGAVAKYTTSVSGSDTATVAKWLFEVNDVNMTVAGDSASMTFDLFGTIMDSNGTEKETDVKENLIAPGTSGKFDLKIENLSEVNAKYDLNFSVSNESGIPLQFSLDNGKSWKSYDKISELNIGNKAIAMGTGTDTITVQWKWDFEGTDATDTKLGIAAQNTAPTVSVTCAATFTQVN